MTWWILALLTSTGCPEGERFVETNRATMPAGPLEVVRPKPVPSPRAGCVDGELGRDCAFVDDDQRRLDAERARLMNAPVVGVAHAVDNGVCLPASLKGALWLRTSAGHWWLGLAHDERPVVPRKRGPRVELISLSVSGVPAGASVLVLPSAKVMPGDGGTLEFDVIGPVDTVALTGTRTSTFTFERVEDGGVSTVALTALPLRGPELRVVGGGAEVQATVHAWTQEAGAYDPALSTRRTVSVRNGRGQLPVLEPAGSRGAVSVVEATSNALVGATRADPSAALITVTLAAPATLRLPKGHRVSTWYLVEDVGEPGGEPCQGMSQPWKTGRITRGAPATVRVPAGPGRCLWLQHELDDGTATPWLVPVPAPGQSVQLPAAPPEAP